MGSCPMTHPVLPPEYNKLNPVASKANLSGSTGMSFLLVLVLVFQISVLPDMLELKPTARTVNALVLGAFIVLALNAFRQKSSSRYSCFSRCPLVLFLLGTLGISFAI